MQIKKTFRIMVATAILALVLTTPASQADMAYVDGHIYGVTVIPGNPIGSVATYGLFLVTFGTAVWLLRRRYNREKELAWLFL